MLMRINMYSGFRRTRYGPGLAVGQVHWSRFCCWTGPLVQVGLLDTGPLVQFGVLDNVHWSSSGCWTLVQVLLLDRSTGPGRAVGHGSTGPVRGVGQCPLVQLGMLDNSLENWPLQQGGLPPLPLPPNPSSRQQEEESLTGPKSRVVFYIAPNILSALLLPLVNLPSR